MENIFNRFVSNTEVTLIGFKQKRIKPLVYIECVFFSYRPHKLVSSNIPTTLLVPH